jgi:sarcosine oxidase subunit beta
MGAIPATADVAIIGGGIIGISLATHLARSGCSVVLLEKNGVGGGPTGRSLAVISQHYTHPALVQLARASLEIFQTFEDRYGGGCGWVQTGLAVLAGQDNAPMLQDAVAMQQAQQVDVRLLSPNDITTLDPRIATEDVAIASYQPTAGYADPLQTVHTLRQAAVAAGASICEGVAATQILASDSFVKGVATTAGTVEAPVAIDVAGPWATAIAASAGIPLPLTSCRQVMAVLQRPLDFGRPHLSVNDFILGTSFRTEGNATYIGWFDRRQIRDRIEPDDFTEGVPGESVAALGCAWKQRYPSGQAAIARGGWCGLYDVTPDWMPIVDRVGPEGFYLCCGTSGHGFKFGPILGQEIAAWVTGSDAKFDLLHFNLQRFTDS